jgi:glycolate oxidase FAD binding subunit
VIYDWGGGLIWAALPPAADGHAKALRQRVDTIAGHATLIRASDAVRAAIDVFHPQPAGLAALGQRVKRSFDPSNILNRGRMSRGSAT